MRSNFYKLFILSIFIVASISVSKLSNGQIITSVAGDGYSASPNSPYGRFGGDGGPANSASFSGPFGVAVDDSNNIYIGDCYNNRIRKVNAITGIITTIAGNGSQGYSGDNGPATSASLYFPTGVALDDSGNVYFADLYNVRIRKITKTTGIISTIAGTGFGAPSGGGFSGDGGPATNAEIYQAYGVAVDHSFNVYIADSYNNRVRKIDKSTGIITTIAGDGTNAPGLGPWSGDGGPATSAQLSRNCGVAVDDSGNVYISDSYNSVIRKVNKLTGIITTIGGTSVNGYSGDNGSATSAQMSHSLGLAVDHFGNVYAACETNDRVRKISGGIITTVAGNGAGSPNSGDSTGDGGLATAASLYYPETVALDKCGNLYIADYFNNRIRKVTFNPIPVSVNVTFGTLCSGDSITLKAFGADSYTWSPSTGLSSTTDSVVVAKPTITTTYLVTGTSGCATANATSVITVNSAGVPITISPVSPKVCAGQSVTLSVPAGSSNVVWTPSAGLNTTTGDTVIVTSSTNQVYTATTGGTCPTSGTDTVTILSTNPLTFFPTNPQVCPGQQTAILVTGGSNLNWSPSTGLNKATGDTVLAQLVGSSTSAVYTVTGVDTSGCSVTGSVTLSSGGSAVGGFVTAVRDTICQGTPGNLTLSNNSSNTIQWQSSSDGNNFTDAIGDTSVKYKTQPLLQSTWYRATVGSGSCTGLSDTLQLVVPPPLTAYFNVNQTAANQLAFDSDSSGGNIRSYHWDFGDGNTSTEKNPQHTYTKDTTYYVCLTLYDGSNCSYTFCRYSDVTDAVPSISATGNWIIYPNPFSEQLTVSSKQFNNHIQRIEMYDVLGQLVLNKTAGSASTASLQLDVSSLAAGMYYVTIRTANANYVQKVVKQ